MHSSVLLSTFKKVKPTSGVNGGGQNRLPNTDAHISANEIKDVVWNWQTTCSITTANRPPEHWQASREKATWPANDIK